MTRPAIHYCLFRHDGFPRNDHSPQQATACGVAYHHNCVQVGEPFKTRLPEGMGLVLPWEIPLPHYICELCNVRTQL
jgi:hypothetical protein